MDFTNKTELKNFRKDFENVVTALETQYNIKIALGNISYTGSEFHAKMSVTTGDEEVRADQERERFRFLASRYGFREEDFMAQVKGPKGRIFDLVGFNTKAPKNPCILRNELTGEEGRASVDYVRIHMV